MQSQSIQLGTVSRRYPVFVRVIAGSIAAVMATVAVSGLVFGMIDVMSLKTLAIAFGCIWLGFIAATGVDLVDHFRKLSENRK